MNNDVIAYNNQQQADRRPICELLASVIQTSLPEAENKLWHGAPVWFINGNPIAGYNVLKDSVRLLFWSGQSFNEPGLRPEGSFKAAEARYTDVAQIDNDDLRRWLDKSKLIQWDYKNIVKRRGELIRLDIPN
jgi:hypothetical protein